MTEDGAVVLGLLADPYVSCRWRSAWPTCRAGTADVRCSGRLSASGGAALVAIPP